MKEDMLEVLIYLFENYIVDGVSFEPGQDELAKELVGAGFFWRRDRQGFYLA